jgi:hypothetical protein
LAQGSEPKKSKRTHRAAKDPRVVFVGFKGLSEIFQAVDGKSFGGRRLFRKKQRTRSACGSGVG